MRGGLDILEAFATLHERYPQLRLTLRTALPPLDDHYHRIIEKGWVRVINRFLTAEEMADLHADSHIFLLPAAHPHRLAAAGDVLRAGRGGVRRLGHRGVSRTRAQRPDRQGPLRQDVVGRSRGRPALRENYEPMYTADPRWSRGSSRRCRGWSRRSRCAGAWAHRPARRADDYTLGRWNQGLAAALDRAGGNGLRAVPTSAPTATEGGPYAAAGCLPSTRSM